MNGRLLWRRATAIIEFSNNFTIKWRYKQINGFGVGISFYQLSHSIDKPFELFWCWM